MQHRDRRGRGIRGAAVRWGAGEPGVPRPPSARPRSGRERFDGLVLGVAQELEERWSDRLGLVEYAVEDTPQIPDDWSSQTVPLASLVRGTGGAPSRLVVFRRPVEHRCDSRDELEASVLMLVVEQVAELLGVDPAEVDPRYDPGE